MGAESLFSLDGTVRGARQRFGARPRKSVTPIKAARVGCGCWLAPRDLLVRGPRWIPAHYAGKPSHLGRIGRFLMANRIARHRFGLKSIACSASAEYRTGRMPGNNRSKAATKCRSRSSPFSQSFSADKVASWTQSTRSAAMR